MTASIYVAYSPFCSCSFQLWYLILETMCWKRNHFSDCSGFLSCSFTAKVFSKIFHQVKIRTLGCPFHVSKLLFADDVDHCVHWDFNATKRFSAFFPVPEYNPVLEVYRQFHELHCLVCALTWTVNCGTFCRQVCAFSNCV